MVKKSLGYTKMVWTCQNCGTRNPGPVKTCVSCGNPQPKDVQFEQASKEDLLKDAEELKHAKAGADIHCPYCGTRNPSGAKTCSQCLGDLGGGVRRQSGRVVGAHRKEEAPPVICPVCGTPSQADSKSCSNCGSPLGKRKTAEPAGKGDMSDSGRLILIGMGLALVIAIIYLLSRGFSKDTLTGIVSQANWERSIAVEQYQWVAYENWWDAIPDDAEVGSCEERYRYTSAEPVENSLEVCGTPYSVETGGGYAEVVQDCQYEVYDYYCDYQVSEWGVVNTAVEQGSGPNAFWPSIQESGSQRTGAQKEHYVIEFNTPDGLRRFETDDFDLYQDAQVGSEWELTVDGFGNIRDVRLK